MKVGAAVIPRSISMVRVVDNVLVECENVCADIQDDFDDCLGLTEIVSMPAYGSEGVW